MSSSITQKTLLATLVLLCCSNVYAAASTSVYMPRTHYDDRCYAEVPPYVKNPKDQNLNGSVVSITADSVDAELNSDINYSGNVEIIQGNKKLKASNTTFNQQTQIMSATGDIEYQDGELTISSKQNLKSNLETNNTELTDADYHINGTLIRGKTQKVNLDNDAKTITLKDATVTTCPKNEEVWAISSTEINIDQNEIFGEAYNTVFWLHEIPIMYLPYINFPTKNERKTGFLYPSFSRSSSDGVEFGLPFYWNIAPNYDMTFKTRVIERRGILLADEFRYMPFENTTGLLYGEYMHHDRKIIQKGNPEIRERYFFHADQQTTWSNGEYGLDIDYSKVRTGDFNYINDYDPQHAEDIDGQIRQMIKTYTAKKNYEGSIYMLSYQIMLPSQYLSRVPFKLLPRVDFNYHDTIDNFLAYNMKFEFSNFKVDDNSASNTFEAQRYHFQPEIEIPIISTSGINLRAKETLFYTYYNQTIPEELNSKYRSLGFSTDTLESSVDRFLYRTDVNGRMTFAKYLDNNYTVTIEPHVQYLYIPYKNQDAIGVYDTTDISYDYYSLFSDFTYAGLDRISDTNRVSYGLTSRIYDDNYRERFKINIGQAYDFVPKRVTMYPNNEINYYPRTPISANVDANFNDSVSAHADLVYNTQENETSSWNGMLNLNHQGAKGQLSYRYTRDGNRTTNQRIIDLRQLGILAQIPITDDFTVIGAMYRDLEQQHDIDKKLALKYESCCYSIGFQIERYNKPDNYTLKATNETTLGIFFELKGLANLGVDTDFSLGTSQLPYNNTVNLNK